MSEEDMPETSEFVQEGLVELASVPHIEDLGDDIADVMFLSAETAVSSLENNIGRLSHVISVCNLKI